MKLQLRKNVVCTDDGDMIDLKTLTKRYYSIGEVADLFELRPSVLRFWEEQFPQLKPRKSSGGNRLYTQKDIETIHRIHHLVREEGYTLDGAEKTMRTSPVQTGALDAQQSANLVQRLTKIRRKLKSIQKRLDYFLAEDALDEHAPL